MDRRSKVKAIMVVANEETIDLVKLGVLMMSRLDRNGKIVRSTFQVIDVPDVDYGDSAAAVLQVAASSFVHYLIDNDENLPQNKETL